MIPLNHSPCCKISDGQMPSFAFLVVFGETNAAVFSIRDWKEYKSNKCRVYDVAMRITLNDFAYFLIGTIVMVYQLPEVRIDDQPARPSLSSSSRCSALSNQQPVQKPKGVTATLIVTTLWFSLTAEA